MFNTTSPPYKHGNYAVTEDFLEEIVLVLSGEVGQQPIPEADGGYENIEIAATEVKSFTVPEEAVAARMYVRADPSATDKTEIINYKENGSDPTASTGFPYADKDYREIYGRNILLQTKMIGIEQDKTHTVRIQYFKTAQNREI